MNQLDCSLRWSKKGGIHLTHPKLGRLKTSLKGGCPQLNREQAMSLINELESAKLSELTSRLQKVQAYLRSMKGLSLERALDTFVGTGSYSAALDLLGVMPFLKEVPDRLCTKLAVDLQGVNGWELLKALPFNRRLRKRLHQSHDWVLNLSASPAEPGLRHMCREQHVELVEFGAFREDLACPCIWKALCWAAFTGRVAGIVSDAPMRTWSALSTDESGVTRLRSKEHPWGVPDNSPSIQAKVDGDTVAALQPMWLWTLASISKGEGVPMCHTHAMYPEGANECWMQDVVRPFMQWSNCSDLFLPSGEGIGGRTRPMKVCTNLGLSLEQDVRSTPSQRSEGAARVHGWPHNFQREVSLALFGASGFEGSHQGKVPKVNTVGAGLQPDEADGHPDLVPQGEASGVREAGQEGEGRRREEPDSPAPPSGGVSEVPGPAMPSAQPARQPISEKEKDKWRRHIAAHHIPFRKDCVQCVMSGALGLQHRRVKCPSMYALAFDLTGPFIERGKDDKGGGYKYALVAGLRVPDIALPEPEQAPKASPSEQASKGKQEGKSTPQQVVAEDDASSEASWLNADLEPTALLKKLSEEEQDGDDQESLLSWFEAPDLDDLLGAHPDHEVEVPEGEGQVEGTKGDDPWADEHDVTCMTDEQFDEELSKLLFSGANKVLRFVVPLQSRKWPQILAGLQEIVTECGRLGFPVKVVHTDRAKELMSKSIMDWLQSQLIQPSFTQGDDPKSNGLAERLVGWVKARARLHLASSGLGLEHWPAAMTFACAEQRRRLLQQPGKLPRFGQKVIFKSKHPTGKSKKPFLRWEHALYLYPTPRTEGGHVLLRAASGAFLVAKNVRCLDELVDPEAEYGGEEALQADPPNSEPTGPEVPTVSPPPRRVTGKRAVRSVSIPSEAFAVDLMNSGLYTADHCGRLLDLAFGGLEKGTRRTHRGPMDFAVILGAYCHGGLKGVTRASHVHPMVCRYLNEYLRRNTVDGSGDMSWTAITVVVAPQVAMHRDVRNEPGSVNYVAQVTTRSMWIEGPAVEEPTQVCLDSKGKEHQGLIVPLTHATMTFNPKQRHAVLPATNWVIAGYSPLGSKSLPDSKRKQLESLGFKIPLDHPLPSVCKLVGPCPDQLPRIRPRVQRPPRRAGLNVRYARMSTQEWAELCQLDEEQFEARISRWQRVLGGADEDPHLHPASAAIPHALLVATVFQNRNWEQSPGVYVEGPDGPVLAARVTDFADDGPAEEGPFPDRMLMFAVHDVIRDIQEMVILRVVLVEEETREADLVHPILQPPGPPPREIRVVTSTLESPDPARPRLEQLPVPLPNPTCIRPMSGEAGRKPPEWEDPHVFKAEASTTKDLEQLLEGLVEPLSVTHTASQEEVRANLERWRPAIEKELQSLKKQGVLVSHFGNEARAMASDAETSIISLKGVFTAKAPGDASEGMFKRKCRVPGYPC